jgi:NAD(P)-dependent dehydrogenase (short-subunit alcohol dehydrogenase family)
MTTVAELMSLKGRRALLTGAAGHIGGIAARTLAELGAELVLVDRPGAGYGSLLQEIETDWSIRPQIIECDLEQESERTRLVETVRQQHSNLDVLINNAAFAAPPGVTGWVGGFEQQSAETWRRALEVNVTAAFDLCRGFAPLLRASPGGSIINLSSIYGTYAPDYGLYEGTPMGNPAAYGVSKAGLIQLTRWLSTTLAPDVRANVLAPGGVFRNQPQEFVKRYEARTPLGRMATEDDFRGAFAYLASDLSRYVTGHTLAVDGGWGVW